MNEVFDKKFFKVLLAAVLVVACSAFIMRLIMNYASAYDNFTEDPVNSAGVAAAKNIGSFYTVATPEDIGRVCFDAYSYCWAGGPACDSGYTFQAFIINTDATATAQTATSVSDTVWDLEDFTHTPWNTSYWATSSMAMCFDFITPVTVTDYAKIGIFVNTYNADNAVFWNYTDIYDANNRLLAPVLSAVYSPILRTEEIPGSYGDATVIELPDWEGTVYVGAETPNIPTYIDCLVGQTDCQTWVNYTFDTIGYDAYLIPKDDYLDLNAAVASSTDLALKLVMREFFILPTQATATTVNYCVILKDPEGLNDYHICETSVYWTEESDLGLPIYDIESACDDVVVSDESTWDDMRYGIECAFRKVIYWAFTPHATSTQNLRIAVEDFKKNFPMSLVNDFSARFDAISEYEGQALTVPVGLWQDSTMPEAEEITNISLSTTTLMSYTDEDFYDQYFLYAQLFLYLLFAFYIFMRVFTILKREEHDY